MAGEQTEYILYSTEYPQKLLPMIHLVKTMLCHLLSVEAISLADMEIVTFNHVIIQLINKVREPPS